MSYRLINVILATLLAALAGIIAYASFQVVREEEAGQISTLGPLDRGTTIYRIVPRTSSDSTKCFGSLAIVFDPDLEDKQISVRGSFRISYRGVEATPSIHGEANFNPIGQLGGSLLSVKIEKTELQLGTRNINPLTLSIRTLGDAAKYNFNFDIPGPIELRRHSKDHYSLASTLFRPLSASVSTKATSQTLNQLPLLERSDDPAFECSEEDRIAFGIESMSTLFGSASQAIDNPLKLLMPLRDTP